MSLAPITGTARSGQYFRAWVSSPDLVTQQLTHGVEPGTRVASCGVMTHYQGGEWPAEAWGWDSPLGRCPACARVVYATT